MAHSTSSSLPLRLASYRAELAPHQNKLTFWQEIITRHNIPVANAAARPRCWLTNKLLTRDTADLMFLNLTGKPWGEGNPKVSAKSVQRINPQGFSPCFLWVHEAVRPFLEAVMVGEFYEGKHPAPDQTADYLGRLALVRFKKIYRRGVREGEEQQATHGNTSSYVFPKRKGEAAPAQGATPPQRAELWVKDPDKAFASSVIARVGVNPIEVRDIVGPYCKPTTSLESYMEFVRYFRHYMLQRFPKAYDVISQFTDKDWVDGAIKYGRRFDPQPKE